MKSYRFTSSTPMAFPSIAKESMPVTLPPTGLATKLKCYVSYVEIGNSSAGDASMGWGIELPDAMWKAGLWDDSEGVSYVDDTTDAQDAGTSDFVLQSTTNNDGFVVQSTEKFNIIRIDVGTAETGSAAVDEYTYWSGSAWSVLPTISTVDHTGTGDEFLQFLTPNDWTKTATGDTPVDTDKLDAGVYAIRYRATTAPGCVGALATDLAVIQLVDYIEKVGDGASVKRDYPGAGLKVPFGQQVLPFCSTANAANWISVNYRFGG